MIHRKILIKEPFGQLLEVKESHMSARWEVVTSVIPWPSLRGQLVCLDFSMFLTSWKEKVQ